MATWALVPCTLVQIACGTRLEELDEKTGRKLSAMSFGGHKVYRVRRLKF